MHQETLLYIARELPRGAEKVGAGRPGALRRFSGRRWCRSRGTATLGRGRNGIRLGNNFRDARRGSGVSHRRRRRDERRLPGVRRSGRYAARSSGLRRWTSGSGARSRPALLEPARRALVLARMGATSLCSPGRLGDGAEACAYARWRGSAPERGRAASRRVRHPRHERSYPGRAAGCHARKLRLRLVRPVPPGRVPQEERLGVNDCRKRLDGRDPSTASGFFAMPSYPEYSADFFDGKHRVMKGARPRPRDAPERSFGTGSGRLPVVWASFRCVTSAHERFRRAVRGGSARARRACRPAFSTTRSLSALRRDHPAPWYAIPLVESELLSTHAKEALELFPGPSRSSSWPGSAGSSTSSSRKARAAFASRAPRDSRVRRSPPPPRGSRGTGVSVHCHRDLRGRRGRGGGSSSSPVSCSSSLEHRKPRRGRSARVSYRGALGARPGDGLLLARTS